MSKTNQPRRHHYVPAFLLAGFTPSGSREDQLWVHDLEAERSWTQRPDQVGHIRDFYRMELPGLDPNLVERSFAEDIEDKAASLLKRMYESHGLPEGEDGELLVSFVTLLAVRTPKFRDLYESNARHFAKWQAQMALSTPGEFEQFVEDMRAEGREIPTGVDKEGLLRFLEDESRYDIVIPREASVKILLESWEHLLPYFLERRWSLAIAGSGEGYFICSDAPVSITPTSEPAPQFLGFGLRGTELTVPLSRELALIGSYENPLATAEINSELVRMINRRTLNFAERFIFSPEKVLAV